MWLYVRFNIISMPVCLSVLPWLYSGDAEGPCLTCNPFWNETKCYWNSYTADLKRKSHLLICYSLSFHPPDWDNDSPAVRVWLIPENSIPTQELFLLRTFDWLLLYSAPWQYQEEPFGKGVVQLRIWMGSWFLAAHLTNWLLACLSLCNVSLSVTQCPSPPLSKQACLHIAFVISFIINTSNCCHAKSLSNGFLKSGWLFHAMLA